MFTFKIREIIEICKQKDLVWISRVALTENLMNLHKKYFIKEKKMCRNSLNILKV